MKTIAHDLAFPSPETENYKEEFGLSKREYFAAKIMAGFAVSKHVWDPKEVAERSVQWADALINTLNERELK